MISVQTTLNNRKKYKNVVVRASLKMCFLYLQVEVQTNMDNKTTFDKLLYRNQQLEKTCLEFPHQLEAQEPVIFPSWSLTSSPVAFFYPLLSRAS